MSPESRGSSEQKLSQLGYSQEFSRTFARFASFAIGFGFISITTGIFTIYGFVHVDSGPIGIWTGPIVIVGQLAVALVFGALAARIPLAGYSYQWMSRFANSHIGWLRGWVAFTVVVGLLVEVVLGLFAKRSNALASLFSAATLLPAIIYAATVILYTVECHKLRFRLGAAEPMVILVAVVCLAYELSIVCDGSFSSPWLYVAVMVLIGVEYAWMRVTCRSLVMPGAQVAPGDEFTPAPATVRS
ncbi:MAG: hypothetical protein ACHQ01_04280 [Candidatus Limnocylindrales bacterium]